MFKLFFSLAMVFSLTASPIWPLGPNPVPGDPFIIVNKHNNQLAYIKDNRVQTIINVATGKTKDLTPEGLFTVTVKAINPYFRKKNIPGGSPKNPLGSRWIGFDANGTNGRVYGIHGTNEPWSIGKYISLGCIRMQNEAVESLFPLVPIGTKVLVTNSKKSFEELAQKYGAIKKKKRIQRNFQQ